MRNFHWNPWAVASVALWVLVASAFAYAASADENRRLSEAHSMRQAVDDARRERDQALAALQKVRAELGMCEDSLKRPQEGRR